MSQPNSNEEKTKSDDIGQFKVISHNPLSTIEKLCEIARVMQIYLVLDM